VPFDEGHKRALAGYQGGKAEMPTAVITPVCDGLFALKDVPLELNAGPWGRMGLVSFHGDDGVGRPKFCHSRFRYMAKENGGGSNG